MKAQTTSRDVCEDPHARTTEDDVRASGGSWAGLSALEPGLRRLLEARCPDANDVDDVIQETYVRAARFRGRDQDPRSLRAWTNRIALNVLSDVRRRARRQQPLPTLEDGDDAALPAALVQTEEDCDVRMGDELLAREDALALLGTAVDGMRADDRALLRCFYAHSGGAKACERRLDVPAHLVKVRVYRARRRLVRRIEGLLARRRTSLPLEVAS